MPLFGGGRNNRNNNNDRPLFDSEGNPQWDQCDPSTCTNEYHWRVIDGELVHDPSGLQEYAQGMIDGTLTEGMDLPNTPREKPRKDKFRLW